MQVEKAMNDAGDKLDPTDKAEVEADLSTLKALLGSDPSAELTPEQVSSIKSAREKLLASSQKLFTKMYEQAQSQANQGNPGAGPNMGGGFGGGAPEQDPNPTPEGDVVDGDFKEI